MVEGERTVKIPYNKMDVSETLRLDHGTHIARSDARSLGPMKWPVTPERSVISPEQIGSSVRAARALRLFLV